MEEIIRKENIRLNLKANNWEEAIHMAGMPLVECGSITETYIENMISSVKELGPYIVLMPGFALAHSAPCDAVIKSDLSIVTFENDISFGQDKEPVRVIMCLACTDKEAHIERLSHIATLLMDDTRDVLSMIIGCKDVDELHLLINQE